MAHTSQLARLAWLIPSTRHSCPLPRHRPLLETLEERTAPATWINPNGGNWGAANNWSPPQVPQPGENVIIGLPNIRISLLSRSWTVGSLSINAGPVNLVGGSINAASVQVNGSLTIEIDLSVGSTVQVNATRLTMGNSIGSSLSAPSVTGNGSLYLVTNSQLTTGLLSGFSSVNIESLGSSITASVIQSINTFTISRGDVRNASIQEIGTLEASGGSIVNSTISNVGSFIEGIQQLLPSIVNTVAACMYEDQFHW